MRSAYEPGQAVVIGASLAGLLAARALVEHVDNVVLVDRDELPAGPHARGGVPQDRHSHGLLARGLIEIEALLPGATDDLVELGALRGDVQAEGRYHMAGGPLAGGRAGLDALLLSRPLLEWYVRRRVTGDPRVSVLGDVSVLDLATAEGGRRVVGVRLAERDGGMPRLLGADLVVDASGRTSRMPEWLERHGYAAPPEDVIRVDKQSCTRVFRRDGRGTPLVIGVAGGPSRPRGGVLLAQEDGRVTVSLNGRGGDRPPRDLPGYLGFAATLHTQEIAEAIDGLEPLDDGATYRFAANRRRHVDRADLPSGLVMVGDAVCSFDPVFGQGMSVAAMQAGELRRAVHDGGTGDLARRFHPAAARHVETPWMIAAGGAPAPVARYLVAVQRAAVHDPALAAAFLRVNHLVDPPSTLPRPARALRVARVLARERLRRPAAAAARVPIQAVGRLG